MVYVKKGFTVTIPLELNTSPAVGPETEPHQLCVAFTVAPLARELLVNMLPVSVNIALL